MKIWIQIPVEIEWSESVSHYSFSLSAAGNEIRTAIDSEHEQIARLQAQEDAKDREYNEEMRGINREESQQYRAMQAADSYFDRREER